MTGARGRGSRRSRLLCAAAAAAVVAAAPGCSKERKWFDTTVTIQRMDVVRTDAKGAPLVLDVEFEYPDCPGDQVEVIRGGAEFAACILKKKIGDKVPARLLWAWHPNGYYDWDVHEMAGCKRPPDPGDEASFDTVRECEPIEVNGAVIGFTCNYLPKKELLAKCPWFRRH